MATVFDPVRPGDLITAEKMNQLLTKLKDLDDRLAKLEGGGSGGGNGEVSISGVLPPGTVSVGQIIQVLGKNFGFVLGAHRVHFDDVPVTEFFNGSNDTLLVLRVPPIPDLPEGGTPVTLTVSNVRTGSTATRQVPVQPSTLEGDIILDFVNVVPATLQPDQLATFRFRVESQASRRAFFPIDVDFSIAALNGLFQLLDAETGQELSGDQIEITPGFQNRKEFLVFFPALSGVSIGDDFTMTVTVGAGSVISSRTPAPFTVGEEAEIPDNTISIGINFDDPDGILNESTNTITLAANQFGTLNLDAGFTVAGTYTVSLTPESGLSNWVLVLLEPTQPYVITESELTAGNGTAARGPRFRAKPNTGASPSGSVHFIIQRQGQERRQIMTFNLALAP